MPNYPETEKIHDGLLEILKCFDQICRENNVKYSLHGGTLLGCIRDKGFIPWDDDVDISITRNEYNKLLKVLRTNDLFKVDLYKQRFPQLWLKTESGEYVWLDIFIWDGISEKKFVQQLKICILAFFLGFTKSSEVMKMSITGNNYPGFRRIIILFLYLFGKIFPHAFKMKLADKFGQILQGKGKFIHRSNDLYRGMKLVLPAYVMSEYEEKEFENIKVMVSSHYHDILVSSYGADYMTPIRVSNNEAEVHTMARNLHKMNHINN